MLKHREKHKNQQMSAYLEEQTNLDRGQSDRVSIFANSNPNTTA